MQKTFSSSVQLVCISKRWLCLVLFLKIKFLKLSELHVPELWYYVAACVGTDCFLSLK